MRLSASITTSTPDPALQSSSHNIKFNKFSTMPLKYQQNHAIANDSPSNALVISAQGAESPVPEGSLAIVFTDIVDSTQIWENLPEAMKQAMNIHDDAIRALTTHHHGYEVKQNGDGFMIAFQTAIAALEFCLDVQKRLMEVEWPQDLLDMRAGSEVRSDDSLDGGRDAEGDILWRGLRLRMSAHFGEPVCKWNEIIGRMDYLGPMVNRAARFIQVTEGGQIVVSEELLDELKKAKNGNSSQHDIDEGPLYAAVKADKDDGGAKLDLQDLQGQDSDNMLSEKHFEVRLLGERHFKGLQEIQKLYFIIPYSLRGRLDFWPQHMHVPGSKGNLVG